MPAIPIPDGVTAIMKYTKAGQLCANVFHVRVPTTPDVAMLNTIGQIFRDAWLLKLQPYTSADVTLTSIEVLDAATPGGLGVEYTTGLPEAGVSASAALPNNVTIATKLSTGRVGRSYRGRFYFLGIPEAYLSTDKQSLLPVVQTALNDFVNELISNLQLSSMSLAVASLYSGVDVNHKPIPRTAGILTDVIGSSVNATLDSQRRRLPERGS